MESVLAYDLDNDGWMDLAASGARGTTLLYNQRRQADSGDDASSGAKGPLVFADLENRGLRGPDRRRCRLSQSRRRAAPAGEVSAAARRWPLAAADFDGDGRTDLAEIALDGSLHLLANQTETRNSWLRVGLTGVKNLKLAHAWRRSKSKPARCIRRSIYQDVPLMFGLGGYKEADTVRITWPNGLIQNEPKQPAGKGATYKEAQRLSGSCPMIFTWNGKEFEFITDVLGVAPLGASSGDGKYFPVDHDEYVQIPGDAFAAVEDGHYEIRITEELREVSYLDQVAADRRRSSGGYGYLHQRQVQIAAISGVPAVRRDEARLSRGRARRARPDVLSRLLRRDRVYPDGFQRDYSGVAELHHLDLDFGKAAADNRAALILNGWVDWADGSTFLGASQQSKDGLVFPYLQVKDSAGSWQTVIEDMGIPAGKPKTISVDLTGKFLSASREVRIVTNLCVYWDEIFLIDERVGSPGEVNGNGCGFGRRCASVDFRRSSIHPGAETAGIVRLRARVARFDVESDAGNVHAVWRCPAIDRRHRRPADHHGLGRRVASTIPRFEIACAAFRLEAGFPAVGGWVGQGWRRQHGLFAVCRTTAVSRDVAVSLCKRRALRAERGAEPVHHASGATVVEAVGIARERPTMKGILAGITTAGLVAIGVAAVAPTAPEVKFTDITAAAGIQFTHNSGRAGKKFLPETLGSGAAFIDADGDGWPDILLINGKDWTPRGRKSLSALYRNNKNGTFTDITAGSGLDVEMYGMGVAVADYDNDGKRRRLHHRARRRPAVPQRRRRQVSRM